MDSRGYSEIAGFFLPGNGKHPASKRKANRKHQHSKMGGRHGGRPLKIFPYFFPLQLFRQLSRIYCKSGKLRENRRFLVCNLRPFPRCEQFESRHSDQKTACIYCEYKRFSMIFHRFVEKKYPFTDCREKFSLMFSLYGLETPFINASMRSALACFICSVTWPYTSSVKDAVWCPRLPCTVFISSPACRAATA